MKNLKCSYSSPELHDIIELTKKLCNLPDSAISRSKSAEAYWSKMMRILKSNMDTLGYNVVYAALFCIHWGTYPKDMPNNPDLLRLADLLKAEFLIVNTETNCAKARQLFGSSLTKVLKSESPYSGSRMLNSKMYRYFLESKTLYKLYGGELEAERINLLTTSVEEFADMQDKAWRLFRYEKMKKYIKRLIPAASEWSDDEFSNDSAIVAQLQNEYGVNLAWCNKNFDQLVKWLENPKENWYMLVGLTSVPLPLAEMIWPNNTDACIDKFFCDVYYHVCEYIKYTKAHGGDYSDREASMQSELQNSWLYHQIATWYDTKSHNLSDKARTCYLNISLGIF